MIAFRWYETAGSLFVCLVDLHPYVVNSYPVAIAETIISTNFLERLGAGWYQQVHTISMSNLTFFSLT